MDFQFGLFLNLFRIWAVTIASIWTASKKLKDNHHCYNCNTDCSTWFVWRFVTKAEFFNVGATVRHMAINLQISLNGKRLPLFSWLACYRILQFAALWSSFALLFDDNVLCELLPLDNGRKGATKLEVLSSCCLNCDVTSGTRDWNFAKFRASHGFDWSKLQTWW